MKYFVEKEGKKYILFRLINDAPNVETHMDVIALHVPICILITMIPLTFYEFSKHLKRNINNTVYIRRFSTYSMTFYVFEGVMSCLAKTIFSADNKTNKVYPFMACTDVLVMLGVVVFYAFILSMISITVDAGKGVFTLEWVM